MNTFFQPNKETWETAIQENKPLILVFQDKLCLKCRLFEDIVISNTEVQKVLYSEFIPLFLDIISYPDIYYRYSDASGPKHTIHSVTGGTLGQCSIKSPDYFLKNLRQLKKTYPKVNDPFLDYYGIDSFKNIIIEETDQFHQKIDLISEITLTSLLQSVDQIYGGWATNDVKYHPNNALEFLLLFYHRSRDVGLLQMILDVFNSSYQGLYEDLDGGFYECANHDWSRIIVYQKSLQNNIAISKNLFHIYQVTKDDLYLDILHKTLSFCFKQLWDDITGLFRYSQLFKHEVKEFNDFFSAKANCTAASFLLEVHNMVSEITEQCNFLPFVNRILNTIKPINTMYGIPHNLKFQQNKRFLLEDQAAYLELLLKSYSLSGNHHFMILAKNQLEIILEHYFNKNILLFKDRVSFPDQDFGPLGKILYPARENAKMIENLITYSYLTEKKEYLDTATRCVTSYYSNFGISREAPYPPEFVIANQRIVESPLELIILGPKDHDLVQKMLIEMKRIYDPFKIIQILDPSNDELLIQKKSLEEQIIKNRPVAFVKIENTISPPALYPKQIKRILNTLLEAIKFGDGY